MGTGKIGSLYITKLLCNEVLFHIQYTIITRFIVYRGSLNRSCTRYKNVSPLFFFLKITSYFLFSRVSPVASPSHNAWTSLSVSVLNAEEKL